MTLLDPVQFLSTLINLGIFGNNKLKCRIFLNFSNESISRNQFYHSEQFDSFDHMLQYRRLRSSKLETEKCCVWTKRYLCRFDLIRVLSIIKKLKLRKQPKNGLKKFINSRMVHQALEMYLFLWHAFSLINLRLQICCYSSQIKNV